jgi:beta-glucosidase
MPKFSASDLDEIKIGGMLDTFGINYYGGSLVKASPESDLGFEGAGRQFQFKNQLGWSMFIPPAYPAGLQELLLRLHARYERAGMKRIVISENGTAWNSEIAPDGSINDEYRSFYLFKHLEQVFAAARSGVPVDGYFLWTFMDNYEWAEGYRPDACFGIVHIDRQTMKRTPKASFHWYRELIQSGVLSNPAY